VILAKEVPQVIAFQPEALETTLEAMARAIPGLRVVVVGDQNGLPIASRTKGTRSIAATAVATLIVTAAGDLAETLELREFSDVLVEGPTWKVFVRRLRGGFTFMGVLDGAVNLGLVRLEIERRCRQIESALGGIA